MIWGPDPRHLTGPAHPPQAAALKEARRAMAAATKEASEVEQIEGQTVCGPDSSFLVFRGSCVSRRQLV